MSLDQQIEFYRRQYETAKTLKMALVAFGAYAALSKLKTESGALSDLSRDGWRAARFDDYTPLEKELRELSEPIVSPLPDIGAQS